MKLFSTLVIIISLTGCNAQQLSQNKSARVIPASSDLLRITGRVKSEHDSVSIYWQGTSILFRFRGSSASFIMTDERGENYFNLVVDGTFVRYFRLKQGRQTYAVVNVSQGDHTVELHKRTEWDKGKSVFHGVMINDGASLLPLPAKSSRTIEFFGNSITSGYANENYSGGDSPDSSLTNNYNSYAAMTARYFNANYYCTSKSGIGIMLSWFPLTMPQLFNRLDPADSSSRWNFRSVTPQVVVINLLQNDSWLVKLKEHESFKAAFGTTPPTKEFIIRSYQNFVTTIRSTYPEATIVCLLGPMDITKDGSPWPGYVKSAVDGLNDKKILYHFFPFTAGAGHPRVEENAQAAKELIQFIEQHVKW